LTNGTAGSADYTTTNVLVTFLLGCNYWNGIGTNNQDNVIQADEETFLLLMEQLLLQELSNNDTATVATITDASATEGSDADVNFTLSNF
jgi:hypothetical protein